MIPTAATVDLPLIDRIFHGLGLGTGATVHGTVTTTAQSRAPTYPFCGLALQHHSVPPGGKIGRGLSVRGRRRPWSFAGRHVDTRKGVLD
jgi:hypothetical protein